MSLDQIKAVIFDWDGTLVDSTEIILKAHNHVRAAMGKDLWSMCDLFGCSSKSARETYPVVYGERSDEALEMLIAYTNEHHLTGLQAFSDSAQLLDSIMAAGFTMGVVSNKRHELLVKEVAHCQWDSYFETVIGAGVAERDKPNAAPLLKAIENLPEEVKISEVLYVGDTETDMLCAKNAGCHAALIQESGKRPELVEEYAPLFVYDKLAEFTEVFSVNRCRDAKINAC